MSRYLSYEEAVQALEAVVERKGRDYVYQKPSVQWPEDDKWEVHFVGDGGNCLNWLPDGTPSCIVGQLVVDKGWLPGTPGDITDNESSEVTELFTELDIEVDEKTMQLLRLAQTNQDLGIPYGEAVDRAKDRWRYDTQLGWLHEEEPTMEDQFGQEEWA